MMRLGTAFLFLSLGSTQALADLESDCKVGDIWGDFDIRIQACTVLLTQGQASPLEMDLYYANRAMAYLKAGRPKDAIADLDKTIEFGVSVFRDHFLRAIAYERLGDKKRARIDFDKGFEASRSQAVGFTWLGIAYQRSGDKKGTIAAFRKAIALDPHDEFVQEFAQEWLQSLGVGN